MMQALMICEKCKYIWSNDFVVDICPQCKEISAKLINKLSWAVYQKELYEHYRIKR